MTTIYLNKKAFGILLGALFFYAVSGTQAQVIDSTNQKPALNNELPGAPVPVQTPPSQTTPVPQPTAPPPQPAPRKQPTPRTTQPQPDDQGAPVYQADPNLEPLHRKPGSTTGKNGEELPATFLDRTFIGSTGGIGFGADSYSGNNYFNVSLSPFVGYRILSRWAVGPGVTYEYVGTNGYHLSTYGGKLFTQVDLFKGILLHAEHEVLSVADLEYSPSGDIVQTRRSVSNTLAGGGYRQMNGDFGMDLYVLFNLNSGVYQYRRSNPVVRVGFIYNLHSRRN
ncbi:hypothetical protein [Adhaeribacter pallidiroseus]|uniref:Outer membrane protein beta-barrel domain-containing protein n=1 Tax=Adhaeribacter pallidiroseus TaxID=2072847 RepID=A0A369QGP0_9BACT|nr:hypothetical protein [Adhaeribacter pallidiroseus]RDC63582.1 hypothetical protein AHMF7616_02187 [Adhaeribacter pallidiroseus]